MAKQLPGNFPCYDHTGCGSSDALRKYDDGSAFCFSCQTYFADPPDGDSPPAVPRVQASDIRVSSRLSLQEIKELRSTDLGNRKISKAVTEFFGVKVSFKSDGTPEAHYYPYEEDVYKIRKLPKEFSWLGKSHRLFGQNKFPGANKILVITEGEIDCMSVAQCFWDAKKIIYPVVALSSATIAQKSLLENRDWVRSFQKVILCFDEDEAGQKALDIAAKVIGYDKVYRTHLPKKDANEVLQGDGPEVLSKCIYNAVPYVPAGIATTEDLWRAIETYDKIPAIPYPPCLAGLNKKLRGIRQGEITLFVAGTGAGKSTTTKEILLWLNLEHKCKTGIVSLEEAIAETARRFSGMALNRNPSEEEIPLEDLRVGFDQVFQEDRLVVLDHQGSVSDDSILDHLEYMALSGCTHIVIDHITILVSEGVKDLTGNEAQDKMMNDLLRLVKRHNVWVGLVSHLRKTQTGKKSFEEGAMPSLDDIKGSGSIKQVSFDVVAFSRNSVAKTEAVRNTIRIRVLKARHTGLTGDVNGATYDLKTGRLTYAEKMDLEETDGDFVSID